MIQGQSGASDLMARLTGEMRYFPTIMADKTCAQIAAYAVLAALLARADVVIRPDLPDMGGSDFASRNRAILAGEQATAAALPALREKLAAARTRPATPGTVATQ